MRNATLTILVLLMLVSCVLLATPTLQAATDPTETAPAALFLETGYLFPAVVEGTQVVHDFVIRNTGNAELQIKQIKTG
ncbi:MAG: hypothetical protein JEZ11_18340 [Desulfobacterales bacterium]|nr:hypothetical protein [Desulfobacterales bacterium]